LVLDSRWLFNCSLARSAQFNQVSNSSIVGILGSWDELELQPIMTLMKLVCGTFGCVATWVQHFFVRQLLPAAVLLFFFWQWDVSKNLASSSSSSNSVNQRLFVSS
jgi:hypothetical protein